MTREEAIKSLNTLRESINGVFDYNCRSQCTALGMAIKALEQQQKVGRWILSGGYWRCSKCKEKALLKLDKSKGGCREYMPISTT